MTKNKKPSKCKQQFSKDLIFTFRYVCLSCYINEAVPEETRQKIQDAVKQICNCIVIDKSYVEFKENKHEDVFMLENGWNELCDLVYKTNFGKKATKSQNNAMHESFSLMIMCYIYLFLENLSYDTDMVILEFDKNSKFMVEYSEDNIQEWKHYPGKWQTWYLK